MAHIGHPILGDSLYPIPEHVLRTIPQEISTTNNNSSRSSGSSKDKALCESVNQDETEGNKSSTSELTVPRINRRVHTAYHRLCLHALHLTFIHPVTHATISLSALPPPT